MKNISTIADFDKLYNIEQTVNVTPTGTNVLLKIEVEFDTKETLPSKVILLNDKKEVKSNSDIKGLLNIKYIVHSVAKDSTLEVGKEVYLNSQLYDNMAVRYNKALLKTKNEFDKVINNMDSKLYKTIVNKYKTYTVEYFDFVPEIAILGTL